jgi:hypothetical protein
MRDHAPSGSEDPSGVGTAIRSTVVRRRRFPERRVAEGRFADRHKTISSPDGVVRRCPRTVRSGLAGVVRVSASSRRCWFPSARVALVSADTRRHWFPPRRCTGFRRLPKGPVSVRAGCSGFRRCPKTLVSARAGAGTSAVVRRRWFSSLRGAQASAAVQERRFLPAQCQRVRLCPKTRVCSPALPAFCGMMSQPKPQHHLDKGPRSCVRWAQRITGAGKPAPSTILHSSGRGRRDGFQMNGSNSCDISVRGRMTPTFPAPRCRVRNAHP